MYTLNYYFESIIKVLELLALLLFANVFLKSSYHLIIKLISRQLGIQYALASHLLINQLNLIILISKVFLSLLINYLCSSDARFHQEQFLIAFLCLLIKSFTTHYFLCCSNYSAKLIVEVIY